MPVAIIDSPHLSDEPERDDDGWHVAHCSCGWSFGAPLPDEETRTDVLMQHAYEAGRAAANSREAE